MILSDRVSGQLSAWGILAAVGLAVVALPGWSPGQSGEPAKAASAADDPVLRDLIEKGKFAEAKERLAALRKKEGVDRSVAEGVFPERWKAVLAKELPASVYRLDLARGDAKHLWTLSVPLKPATSYFLDGDEPRRLSNPYRTKASSNVSTKPFKQPISPANVASTASTS